MRTLRVIIAAALLLSCRSAFAAGWLKITSPNFELFTTTSEKKGREAILYFEQVRDLFLRIRPTSLLDPLPVRLIAFQSEKDYKRFRMNEFAAAYYLGGNTRDYIVMGDISAEHYPMAVHEYSHLLVKHAGLKLPRWLDEGWADVNSTVEPHGSKVMIGSLLKPRVYTLNQNKWMSLEALTSVNYDSPEYNDKDKAGIFYAQSWLLTHMLYLSNDYRPQFSAFLNRLMATNSSVTAFRDVYGKSLVDVRKDLESYMRDGSINVAVFDAKLEKSSEVPVAQPASDLEAGLVQADLLTHLSRRDEASAIYQRLANDYPKSWEVEQALGYLAWRKSEIEAAKGHFGRAKQLGSTDGKLYLDYAKLLQGDPSSDALMMTVLLKAVDLRPDLTDARLLLGFHCYNTHDYKGAIEHLGKVKKIEPERASSFFQVLSFSQLQLGNRQAAKQEAEKARSSAKTPTEIQKTEELLKLLNDGPIQPAPALPSGPTSRVEGTLQGIECSSETPRVHILANGEKLVFVIADSGKVQIAKPAEFDIICGEQKGEPVTVEYTKNTDGTSNVKGFVQRLEIRAK